MRMDRYIAKFPDSPFTLSMSGFYYGIKSQMFGNESDIELGLTNLLRSHSILKNSLSKISDLGQIWANQINFQTIPALYLAQKKNDEALKFVTDNKQMICQDGTYDCLDAGSLIMLENGFYHSFQYKEAIEIIEISLNRTQDELTLEGEDFGVKAQAYYRYGMINMKWEEHDKAIEGFTNALKVITDEYNKDFWQPHYHRRLGLVHSKLGNYKKAAEHYYQSYQEIQIQITNNDNTENLMDDEHKTKTKAICSNAYMEALLGSLESAEKSISECTEWLDNNADKINDAHDAYETYWQLYLYYNNLKNKTEAKKYLNLAYESIEKNKIKRWIGKPNRDTDPKYFYSRDIIKTYENN